MENNNFRLGRFGTKYQFAIEYGDNGPDEVLDVQTRDVWKLVHDTLSPSTHLRPKDEALRAKLKAKFPPDGFLTAKVVWDCVKNQTEPELMWEAGTVE